MALDRTVSVRSHHSHHPSPFELSTDRLKAAVEAQHGGTATFVRWVPVTERVDGAILWVQLVSVFELAGHAHAVRAYAWSSPIEGSDERRVHAVLHGRKISSPVRAVRAVMAEPEPRPVTVEPKLRVVAIEPELRATSEAAAHETPEQMHARHIAEQEARIEQQRNRIAQLAKAGADTAGAQRFLESMQEFLRIMRLHDARGGHQHH